MTATLTPDGSSPTVVAPPLIDRDLYDSIATAKGYPSVASRAKWHELDRSNLFDILAGTTIPRLDTAFRIAGDCGIPVDVLWKRTA
jgi:hypothetical protein